MFVEKLFSKFVKIILGFLLHNKKFIHWHFCFFYNSTVHAARTTFIAEKKALLSMMSQCLMISKTKFQHSVTNTFFSARFSVKAHSL